MLLVLLFAFLTLFSSSSASPVNGTLTMAFIGSLGYLNNTVFMDLSFEDIVSIDPAAFFPFSRLNTLLLVNNSLTSLDNTTFGNLTRLAHLDLGNNRISSIGRNTFANLTNLRTLNLYGNSLGRLDSNFSVLSSLTTLNLMSSGITSIDDDALAGLGNLEILYLINNSISSLSCCVFSRIPNLRYLYLSYNRIAQIDAAAFSTLYYLRELHLGSNSLTAIRDGTFSTLTQLRLLDLAQNQFSDNANVDYIGSLTSLERFGLSYTLLSSDNMARLSGLCLYNQTIFGVSQGLLVSQVKINVCLYACQTASKSVTWCQAILPYTSISKASHLRISGLVTLTSLAWALWVRTSM